MKRRDQWDLKEDVILAQIVLEYITKGSTQLAAFQEAGKRLKRTPSACGFRWNSTVRKQYANNIRMAKIEREQAKFSKLKSKNMYKRAVPTEVSTVDIDLVIRSLQLFKREYNELKQTKEKTPVETADFTNFPHKEVMDDLLQIIRKAENMGFFSKLNERTVG